MCVQWVAVAHMGQGSRVTYRVQVGRYFVWSLLQARRRARSSACAVASCVVCTLLCAWAMMVWLCTMMAPTGISCRW